jgi:hypothetical protein
LDGIEQLTSPLAKHTGLTKDAFLGTAAYMSVGSGNAKECTEHEQQISHGMNSVALVECPRAHIYSVAIVNNTPLESAQVHRVLNLRTRGLEIIVGDAYDYCIA